MRLLLALLLGAQPLQAAGLLTSGRGSRPVVIGGPAGTLHGQRLAPPFTLPSPAGSLPLVVAPLAVTPLVVSPISFVVPIAAVSAPAIIPAAKVAQTLLPLTRQLLADQPLLPRLSGEGSRETVERQFDLLTGQKSFTAAEVSGSLPASFGWTPQLAPAGKDSKASLAQTPAPDPPSPEVRRSVWMMRAGTAAFKLGMEVVKLGVPLLALQTLGGAMPVALLAVTYGLAQAVSGSWAATLTDRFPASKVLSGAIISQAGLVSVLLLLGVSGLFSPWLLFPLYGLIGAAVGVAETTRRTVPPLLLGQNPAELQRYNGSLHFYYEAAGVGGALLAGLMLGLLGPLNAMLIQPPAFALAAFLFWKVKHPFTRAETQPGQKETLGRKIRAYFANLKDGVRLVTRDRALRWLAVAMILPQIVHRVFEDLLLPVFAKGVLHNGNQSAFMLASSNLGELAGALVLLKLAERFKGSASWVKWSALGLLGAWALTFSTSFAVLLPILLVFSMTWAASDLSLLSDLQSRLKEKDLPRVLSVLMAAAIIGGISVSLLIGRFLDAVPLSTAFIAINAAFSLLALAVYFASKKIK